MTAAGDDPRPAGAPTRCPHGARAARSAAGEVCDAELVWVADPGELPRAHCRAVRDRHEWVYDEGQMSLVEYGDELVSVEGEDGNRYLMVGRESQPGEATAPSKMVPVNVDDQVAPQFREAAAALVELRTAADVSLTGLEALARSPEGLQVEGNMPGRVLLVGCAMSVLGIELWSGAFETARRALDAERAGRGRASLIPDRLRRIAEYMGLPSAMRDELREAADLIDELQRPPASLFERTEGGQ